MNRETGNMDLDDLLTIWRWQGLDPVLETPPACAAVRERACAARIPLGRLLVVKYPLRPAIDGTFNSTTRDIWVWYELDFL